jgi:hypothetical protein
MEYWSDGGTGRATQGVRPKAESPSTSLWAVTDSKG